MPEKAEPFGFRRGTITVQSPPIELNPEIVLPEIHIPEIKVPEIKLPPVEVTVQAPPPTPAPIVRVDPVIKVEAKMEAPIIQVKMPESKGWKFSITKKKSGEIEMIAKPL